MVAAGFFVWDDAYRAFVSERGWIVGHQAKAYLSEPGVRAGKDVPTLVRSGSDMASISATTRIMPTRLKILPISRVVVGVPELKEGVVVFDLRDIPTLAGRTIG